VLEPSPVASTLEWLEFASVVLLGIVSYFLKQRRGDQDKLQDQVQKLTTKIAVLLDRDRRKRIKDYDEEEGDVEDKL
jgi:cell division protein FtsB